MHRIEHRRGVDRLIVEACQELRDDETDERPVREIFRRLILLNGRVQADNPCVKESKSTCPIVCMRLPKISLRGYPSVWENQGQQ